MKDPYAIIREVQVTEKGTDLSEGQNKYMFSVDRSANKLEIKRAVETLFKVQVEAVNTQRYRGKPKRERTRGFGRRPDWKRAIVTLKQGDRIEQA